MFFPIWRIELDAPQYPEGLVMLISASGVGGQVDIINGLNHYIGMAQIKPEDFVEFTVLPYVLSAFALALAMISWKGNRLALRTSFITFSLFGILAMVDFWRWEYEYGHNLDPNAAIRIPGMAYQPPLIGYKQLLNFGAFSIPETGGWMLLGAGISLGIAFFLDLKAKGLKASGKMAVVILALFTMTSCQSADGPKPIALNQHPCDYCGMTVADLKFASQIKTDKGRYYSFDDFNCMIRYAKDHPDNPIAHWYVGTFNGNELIDAENAFFVASDSINSPMRANIGTFSKEEDAKQLANQFQTQVLNWKQAKALIQ